MLVTSQVALRVQGEQLFTIAPLDLPDPALTLTVAGAAACSAVDLFVQRAQAVQVGFTLNEENVAAVVAICRRLDGLPLTLELAASRLQLLTPRALLERLETRLGLLVGGARDAPARQQTLRAALDWSYSLLTTDEQAASPRAPGGVRGRLHAGGSGGCLQRRRCA